MEPQEEMKTTSRQRRRPRLILVRHGTPVVEDGLPPARWRLSKAGHDAATALGQKLQEEGFAFHRIVCSPETKALDTARAICGGLGGDVVAVETNPGLSEHARETSGFLPRSEFDEAIARFFRSDPSKPVFGDETADAAFQRFAAVSQQEEYYHLRESVDRGASDVIAVTHGTVMSLYVGRILGIDPFPFWQALKTPTAVVVSGGNQMTIIDAPGSAPRRDG